MFAPFSVPFPTDKARSAPVFRTVTTLRGFENMSLPITSGSSFHKIQCPRFLKSKNSRTHPHQVFLIIGRKQSKVAQFCQKLIPLRSADVRWSWGVRVFPESPDAPIRAFTRLIMFLLETLSLYPHQCYSTAWQLGALRLATNFFLNLQNMSRFLYSQYSQ